MIHGDISQWQVLPISPMASLQVQFLVMTACASCSCPPDARLLSAPIEGAHENDPQWLRVLVIGRNLDAIAAAAGDLGDKVAARVATSTPWKTGTIKATCKLEEVDVAWAKNVWHGDWYIELLTELAILPPCKHDVLMECEAHPSLSAKILGQISNVDGQYYMLHIHPSPRKQEILKQLHARPGQSMIPDDRFNVVQHRKKI